MERHRNARPGRRGAALPPFGLRATVAVDAGGSFVVFSHPLPEEVTQHRACLTPAEREVVELLLEDLSASEIAARRGCRTRTITKHIEAIHKKLDVHSRRELLAALG